MVPADLGSSSEMGLNIIVCLQNAIVCYSSSVFKQRFVRTGEGFDLE